MYDLQLIDLVKRIKKEKAKRICIQLPDGLNTFGYEFSIDSL